MEGHVGDELEDDVPAGALPAALAAIREMLRASGGPPSVVFDGLHAEDLPNFSTQKVLCPSLCASETKPCSIRQLLRRRKQGQVVCPLGGANNGMCVEVCGGPSAISFRPKQ